ncbi:MAG: hypothetical protein M3Z32_09015 [Acidobacteriota bacterium]|nr:hypothetical protein [Acidobacteriota bacterium]
MSGIQNELGPKGFQAIEAAINENPEVPTFIQQFKPTFPVGVSDNGTARNYMQLSTVVHAYVPFLLFIDRTGVIRSQYTGSDPLLADESREDKNLRAEITKLLAENTRNAAKPVKRAGKKKS